MLGLSAAGHELTVGDIVLSSDSTTSPVESAVTVVPVTADGTSYGRQVITPATSPKGIAALSSPSVLGPVASLTSPAISVSATSGPSNQAGTSSLGAVKLLGMPLSLSGAVNLVSSVGSTAGAQGMKTVSLKNLALPSLNDLLAALGLDLNKLPVGTLTTLVSQLNLASTAISTAQNTVDAAQAAVNTATATLASKTSALTAAQATLATAQSTLTSALATFNALLTTSNLALLAPLGITDLASFLAASSGNQTAAETLVPGITAAANAANAAQTAVAAAQSAVATAQAAVDAAQAVLNNLVSTLNSALTTLRNAIVGKLDATPLVSLASVVVTTRAAVTSASQGGQHAEIIGGTVSGLKVLGTDVLSKALGSSTLDLTAVTDAVLSKVNGAIGTLTGTLSTVLSHVPSLPLLKVPAPQIGLLTKTATTTISGGFGRASTVVRGLSISIPGITLPTSVAVPGAASLPGLSSVTQIAGQLTSAPVGIGLLTLRDTAAFRPAAVGGTTATGTPGTGMPNTGLPTGAAVLAIIVAGAAFVVRRLMPNE